MTTVLAPLAPLGSLVPVTDIVHRVLGAATRGLSEGARRNARAAIEAREVLREQGLDIVASVPAQRATAALPRGA